VYIDGSIHGASATDGTAGRLGAARRGKTAARWPLARINLFPHGQAGVLRSLLSLAACLVEVGAILSASVLAGMTYHLTRYGGVGSLQSYLESGLVVAFLFALPAASRSTYSIDALLAFPSGLRRAFALWTLAFLVALGLSLIAKTSADFSRGVILLFYVVGFGAIIVARLALMGAAREIADRGTFVLRQVFLVGREADVEAFRSACASVKSGLRIVGASLLREGTRGNHAREEEEELAEDIRLAVSVARFRRPEDIFIMLPWSDKMTIERCVDAFLTVSATIHLAPEKILSRFENMRVTRLGPVVGLNLAREPLSTLEVMVKRLFDLVVSGLTLALLGPFFVLIALLIKLDSRGPVFFVQQRYGFNQEPFPIFKFRSMTVSASQGEFRQATKDDARVTAVGRYLRRWNLDELPQLINVFLGEMSLVGPRPHALQHDRTFEQRVALYARRHNVKPGITGWAQVSGFRGETSTDEMMRARVEHDLYYIDNWSLWFDLSIIWMTMFSGKAYRNAH